VGPEARYHSRCPNGELVISRGQVEWGQGNDDTSVAGYSVRTIVTICLHLAWDISRSQYPRSSYFPVSRVELYQPAAIRCPCQHSAKNQGGGNSTGINSCSHRRLHPWGTPFPLPVASLASLYLLLAGLSTLVSSKHTPSPTSPTVYNNCSGDYPLPLPSGATSTSHFKLQIAVNPHKSGAGWEEWLMFVQGNLPDGSGITYGYRWGRGDPVC